MSDCITIELPDSFDEEEAKEFLNSNIEELYAAMDLVVAEFDSRAQVDDVTIVEISLDSDVISIEYEIDYSAYHGCKDVDIADTDRREIVGERKENKLIFKKFSPPPRELHMRNFNVPSQNTLLERAYGV